MNAPLGIGLGIKPTQFRRLGGLNGGLLATGFDGANDYFLTNGNSLFGSGSNAKTVSGSCWVYVSDTATGKTVVSVGGNDFKVQISGSNIRLVAENSTGTIILNVETNDGPIDTINTWFHVAFGISLGTSVVDIYVNRTKSTTTETTLTDDTIDLDETFNPSIGSESTASKMSGRLSEIWVDNTFIDFDDSANLDKFVTSGIKPVVIGGDGSSVLGSQPNVYIQNGNGTNTGSGDSLATVGAPTSEDGPGA